jgi:hypothetical protein
MLAVGKDLVLARQIGAAGIDEIDAGQPVLQRDLLGAQMLLHRQRIIGPPLTVASLATMTHSRPSTRPMPVMIPAAGTASL